MKRILTFIFVAIAHLGFTQNELDALRYSQVHFGGTARYNGMGGAFGALGGDVSSASTNPAGVGVYRKSEFTFSPTLYSNSTSTTYLNTGSQDFKLDANFNNFAYLWSTEPKSANGWEKINFAFGYNRIANFNNRYLTRGVNDNSSIIDTWVSDLNVNGGVDANSINDNPEYYQGTNMAWQTFLIDYDTSVTSNPYYSNLAAYGQSQRHTTIERGSMGETYFAFGANYSNKLYLGASIGSPKIKFSQESIYSETASETDTLSVLNDFTLTENLNTEGRGYNAKIGVIYRIMDYVRVGMSFQTPTFYSLTDTWSSSMTSTFIDSISFTWDDPTGRYDYTLITPMKASLSSAVQVGKMGLISADYELINYGSARLQSLNGDYDFATENNATKSFYTTTGNLKLGTEWRLNQFKVRAGYSYFGNPLNNTLNADKSFTTYSLGAGYKNSGFFMDVAYNLTLKSDSYYLYDAALTEPVTTNNKIHRITTTVGFRF